MGKGQSERPGELVRCVAIEVGDDEGNIRKEPLCGRPYNPRQWYFQGISHWVLGVELGSGLRLCRDCAGRIERALRDGASDRSTGTGDHAVDVKVGRVRFLHRFGSRLVGPASRGEGRKLLLSFTDEKGR